MYSEIYIKPMLTDIERKILMVICNTEVIWHCTPSINELCIKTGRDPDSVMDVLGVLANEKYLEWNEKSPDDIVILERWERGR